MVPYGAAAQNRVKRGLRGREGLEGEGVRTRSGTIDVIYFCKEKNMTQIEE